MSVAPKETPLLACQGCDLYLQLPVIQTGDQVYCPRCGAMITRVIANASTKIIAISLSAVILLLISLSFPFLQLETAGKLHAVTLVESIGELSTQGYDFLAIVIFFLVLVAPTIFLSLLLYVFVPLQRRYRVPHAATLMRFVFFAKNWSMVEVFGIGMLVSFVKTVNYGYLGLGIAFWSYMAFVIALIIVIVLLDPYQTWQHLKQAKASV